MAGPGPGSLAETARARSNEVTRVCQAALFPTRPAEATGPKSTRQTAQTARSPIRSMTAADGSSSTISVGRMRAILPARGIGVGHVVFVVHSFTSSHTEDAAATVEVS